MKFTKEQAIEEINAKIEAKDKDLDLSRTISESVENALRIVGENDEMELSAFVDLAMPLVNTAAGLAHKNAVTATKTLQEKIAELEKKVPKVETPKPKETEQSEEMKALLARLEKLEKDKADADKAAKITAKRGEIKAAIVKAGVDDNDWVDTLLKEVSVSEDTDVEQKAKDYVSLYQKQHTVKTSITPRAAGGGGKEEIDLSGLDSQLAQLRGDFGTKETKNN